MLDANAQNTQGRGRWRFKPLVQLGQSKDAAMAAAQLLCQKHEYGEGLR